MRNEKIALIRLQLSHSLFGVSYFLFFFCFPQLTGLLAPPFSNIVFRRSSSIVELPIIKNRPVVTERFFFWGGEILFCYKPRKTNCSSTLLFSSFPFAVLLSPMGIVSPYPVAAILLPETPLLTR